MGFFDSIFSGKNSSQNASPNNFSDYVKHSIEIIGAKGKGLDIGGTINLLSKNGIPKNDAIEIAIFMPMGFAGKCSQRLLGPKLTLSFTPKRNKSKSRLRKMKSF